MEVLIIIIIIAIVILKNYLQKQSAIKAAAERYTNWLNGLLKECDSEDKKLAVRFLVSKIEEPYFIERQDANIRDGVKAILDGLPHPTASEFMAAVARLAQNSTTLEAALKKTNLDIDEVTEIEPTQLSGFRVGNTTYTDAFGQSTNFVRVEAGELYTDTYESTWLLLTNDQVVIYNCGVNVVTGKVTSRTEEFFYRDVTSMSTLEETENYKEAGKDKTVETEMFRIVVPGDKFQLAAGLTDNFDSKVQALKSKLREKKTA